MSERSENVPATTAAQAETVRVRRGMFGAADGGDTSGYGGLVKPVVIAAPSGRPYGSYFDEVVDRLAEVLDARQPDGFTAAVEKVVVDRGELTLFLRRASLEAVCQALRDDPDLRFELFSGVSGVHYPQEPGRELHAVYHLTSVTHNRRVRLEFAP